MSPATFLLWAAVASAEPDGGALATIYEACPDASDAGAAVYLDGGDPGWFLPDPRGPRLACKLASCESYAQSPPVVTTAVVVTNIATLVLGIIASVVTAVAVKK